RATARTERRVIHPVELRIGDVDPDVAADHRADAIATRFRQLARADAVLEYDVDLHERAGGRELEDHLTVEADRLRVANAFRRELGRHRRELLAMGFDETKDVFRRDDGLAVVRQSRAGSRFEEQRLFTRGAFDEERRGAFRRSETLPDEKEAAEARDVRALEDLCRTDTPV